MKQHSELPNIEALGDNADVTRCVCEKVGINSRNIVLGSQIEKLTDMGVMRLLKKTNIFSTIIS